MRLLVYYKPSKDIFVVRYTEDRQHQLKLFTYNCYGHLIVQYIYIEDRKVFWNYKDYDKYLNKKYKNRKPSIKYKIGQKIISFGRYICFGKEDKTKVIYVYKDRYPWWKN